jgi:putative nucleotidyltransferase with HDIG domain
VSKTATSYLEINILANMILNEIVSTLHIKKAAFFLKDNLSHEFRLIAHHNLGKNVNYRLSPRHLIADHLEKTGDALSSREINLLPQFKSLSESERYILEEIGAELFIPLKVQGNLVGILAVGQKRSEQAYSNNDKSTIITLANQTAVAIENARLYTAEQTRRKEMDSLYTLSRELVATDAMRSVLDKVVSHSLESIHVTFARILLRDDTWTYTCHAIHPVYGLEYDLRLGKKEPEKLYRYYERAFASEEPLVLDRSKMTLTFDEISGLYLSHVQSLCICPLRIGEEPIGVLILGERRHANREPFDSEKIRLAKAIADQASSAIQRARLHDQMEENFVQTIVALANAIDARDSYTGDHSERLAKLATATAEKLGCTPDEIQAINWGMHLHDIGKIGTPDEILQKPGPLNHEEWLIIQRHPVIGADIIAPVKKLKNVAPLILAHHEKYDGSGYPHGLKKDEIPLGARIIAIVDSYGAITDDRVYRSARSHEEAISEIQHCVGHQFDPHVAAAFFEVIEKYHQYTKSSTTGDFFSPAV